MRVLNMLIPISVSVYIKTKTCVIHTDTSLGMTKRYTFYYIPFTEHMDPADIRGHHLNNWFTYVVTLENVYTLLCYQATAQCIPLLFCSVFVDKLVIQPLLYIYMCVFCIWCIICILYLVTLTYINKFLNLKLNISYFNYNCTQTVKTTTIQFDVKLIRGNYEVCVWCPDLW